MVTISFPIRRRPRPRRPLLGEPLRKVRSLLGVIFFNGLFLSGILLSGCTHALGGGASANSAEGTPLPLEVRIDRLLQEAPFGGIQWGILIVDGESGGTLYERNASTRFIPASNMKLPVTVAALDLLGPDFRWETAFFSESAPVEGTIAGALRLVGTGDPTLGAPFFSSSTEALSALTDSLLAAGVRRVTGPLIVDASAWDSTTVPDSWMVGNLSPTYGATGGAFVVGRGEVAIWILSGTTSGTPATIDWSPRGKSEFIEARVSTATPGEPSVVISSFLPESRRWFISGSVSVGELRMLTLAARDPVRLATDALARMLEEKGVVLEGGVEIEWGGQGGTAPSVGDSVGSAIATRAPIRVEGAAIAGGDTAPGRNDFDTPGPTNPPLAPQIRVAGLSSPPLAEVVYPILDSSQNWMTEQLVRTLGAELGERGSWSEGFRIIEEHLAAGLQIDSLDLHMEDGSGLSAYNLLAPRAIVRILAHAQMAPWGDAFRTSLPTPGRTGGTLDGRLAGLEGRIHAKTGTIMNVNSLSGYLLTNDGRDLMFSILTNGSNLPAAAVRARMDAIVREMAAGR